MKKSALTAAALVASASLFATDATWTGSVDQSNNGSWTEPANWSSNPTLPGGAGASITFPNCTRGDQSGYTTVDGAFTLGSLIMNAGSKNWTIKAGNGGVLTMDANGAMPLISVTNGTRMVDIAVPLAGANGVKIAGTAKSYIRFSSVNTYTGETLVTAPFLEIPASVNIGQTSRFVLAPEYNSEVFLYLCGGVEVNVPIVLCGNSTRNKGFAQISFIDAPAAHPVVINGNVYCCSPSGTAQIFTCVEGRGTTTDNVVTINGNILEYDSTKASNIGLRGESGSCTINGWINLPNGTLTKNGLATYELTNPSNVWKGTTVLFSGTLKMGAAGAYSAGNNLQLTEYGTGGTFDLNGYDQTVGALWKCGCEKGTYYVTSEKPAVLTMQVTDSNGGNATSKGPVVFNGALTLRKTGAGTQSFVDSATGQTTALVSGGIEVKEGRLNLNNALCTAKVTVDGGTLAGTTELRYTATDPETFTFKSGTCDVSHMTVSFTEGVVSRGKHLVFDYSAADPSALTAVADSPVWPFAGTTGLPADCKWRHSPSEKKVYLVRGFGLMMYLL